MESPEPPLIVPIAVPGASLEESASTSTATKLLSWSTEDAKTGGVALGCDDGSIYLFLPKSSWDLVDRTSGPQVCPDRAMTLPILAQSPLPATPTPVLRATSPIPSNGTTSHRVTTVLHGPFLPSKSKIQAEVSKEQVEAPKNYVDYDDEPAKLKSLLKGKGPVKERSVIDSIIPKFERNIHLDRQSAGKNTRLTLDKEEVKSYMSASNSSPSWTPLSLSPVLGSPPSSAIPSVVRNGDDPFDSLRLVAHIFPPRFGQGRKITGLEALERGSLVVSLQECGTVSLFSTVDGQCFASLLVSDPATLAPPRGAAHVEGIIKDSWKWTKLSAGIIGDITFLFLAAEDHSTHWNNESERSKVTLLRIQNSQERKCCSPDEVLSKIGEWIVQSSVANLGVSIGLDGVPSFYHLSSSSHLIVQTVTLLDNLAPIVPSPPPSKEQSLSQALQSIPIPNPFKSRRPRLPRPISIYDVRRENDGRIALGREVNVGKLPDPLGTIYHTSQHGNIVISWTNSQIRVYGLGGGAIVLMKTLDILDIVDVRIVGEEWIAVFTDAQCQYFNTSVLLRSPEINDSLNANPGVSNTLSPAYVLPLHRLGGSKGGRSNISNIHNGQFHTTRITSKGRRKLDHVVLNEMKLQAREVWKSSSARTSTPKITSMLPIGLGDIVVGRGDGLLSRECFATLVDCDGNGEQPASQISDTALDGMVISLHGVKIDRANQHFIIGGTDGGAVALWDFKTLKLVARWTVFATPLLAVIRLEDEAVGRLRGCVICVATGGTLAIISVETLELLYLIPGGPGRLERVCLGEDNLLLVYADDRARLWDVKTQEFWRSMTKEKAEELPEQGGWFEASVEPEGAIFGYRALAGAEKSFATVDGASTLLLNLRTIMDVVLSKTRAAELADFVDANKSVASSTTNKRHFRIIQPLLASLLTMGMDYSTDTICRETLGIVGDYLPSGLVCHRGALSIVNGGRPDAVWRISPDVTTWRLLAICTLLRVCLGLETLEQDISDLLAFYVNALAESVGEGFQSPSLFVLGQFWFDPSPELRSAARALFEAALGRMTDEEVTPFIEEWQHQLPCLQPDSLKEAPFAAAALIVTGNIAIARYSLLSVVCLTDISKSIALYMHDESSVHRVLAIDLCSRGLQIWQHYFETMDILRTLFDLATSTKREPNVPVIRNPASQAKVAVLQVATSSTPLFMTTLSLDILNPKSTEHRKSVMQLLAFLIRKKPLVLYPNLPRLMEAVVKSLDPNSTSGRESILDTATQILGEVVKTYPSIDFHMPSQRLAVGTNEGAVILYDLKTATRLYVLEGHKRRLTACSFSPDGRRLATTSLEESVVMVWKVGTSFTSFFYPGAPPRQGHAGSEPFKTLSFNVGDEAHMTVAATLEWVGFDWPAERSARLRIRDSMLTFAT